MVSSIGQDIDLVDVQMLTPLFSKRECRLAYDKTALHEYRIIRVVKNFVCVIN